VSIDARRVQELFLAAVKVSSIDQRAAFLDAECGDDDCLRERVESLLRSHQKCDSFLERPLVSAAWSLASGKIGTFEAVGQPHFKSLVNKVSTASAEGESGPCPLTSGPASFAVFPGLERTRNWPPSAPLSLNSRLGSRCPELQVFFDFLQQLRPTTSH